MPKLPIPIHLNYSFLQKDAVCNDSCEIMLEGVVAASFLLQHDEKNHNMNDSAENGVDTVSTDLMLSWHLTI